MLKFYLDLCVGECIIRDRDGTELEDQQWALQCALDEIRELVQTRAGSKLRMAEAKMDVCDERRQRLFSVPFSEALTWNVDVPK